ncbi:MAG TPA: DNA polymerase III subunit gamma/tau [Tissierellia bacterium]|nr:DNA polymerase III subunit gamma/tau [Tissierellia bacterium]
MSYLALYRKYRPRTFSDFAGQEETTEALRYQVKSATFGHSYLFSGIRGTGKTSMAQVFAKAINCEDLQDGEPCGKCPSCVSFESGAQMDVLEIDAASNNSVDDIRELRENARFMPAYSKYKVYIIDEVQMLSGSAFNALLKTLEEPAPAVVFILATTEVHKIPETILSRTQRYSFKRISQSAMMQRLSYIAKEEGVDAQAEALHLLCEHSGGALRDAISLLDKTLSLDRTRLTVEQVQKSLGLLGRERIHRLLLSAVKGRIDEALEELGIILREGKELTMIYREILSFLRGILLSRLVKEDALIENLLGYAPGEMTKEYDSLTSEQLDELIGIFDDSQRSLRFSLIPRLHLEMALIATWEKAHGPVQVEVKKVLEKRKVEPIKEEVAPPKDLDDYTPYWQKVLDKLKASGDIATYAFLLEGTFETRAGDTLLISFGADYDFHKNRVNEEKTNAKISAVASEVFGASLKVRGVSKEETPLDPEERLKALFGDASDKLEFR